MKEYYFHFNIKPINSSFSLKAATLVSYRIFILKYSCDPLNLNLHVSFTLFKCSKVNSLIFMFSGYL